MDENSKGKTKNGTINSSKDGIKAETTNKLAMSNAVIIERIQVSILCLE